MNRDLTVTLSEVSRASGPVLTWYSPSERIELSGPVLGRWLAKVAGLVEAEGGPRPTVHLSMPTHWRTVVWACGTWLAGGAVLLGDGAADALPGGGPVGVGVACQEEGLLEEAEAQVLTPLASLALRWPGALPPLVVDGAADLMTYPDTASPAPAEAGDVALVAPGADGLPGGGVLSREGLSGAAASLVGAGAGGLLVRGPVALALVTVLGAWGRGRPAVLVDSACDEALVSAAVRQERASLD